MKKIGGAVRIGGVRNRKDEYGRPLLTDTGNNEASPLLTKDTIITIDYVRIDLRH